MKHSSGDWLALAVLGLLILLFLGEAFLPGKVLLPLDVVTQDWPPWQQPGQPVDVHNPLITDVIDYIYPVKAFAAEQIKQGIFPLWNPYVLSGYPLTYNTQAGLFYPLSLSYYALPPVTAVDLVIFLQMALGGLFMFAYLRLIRLRPLSALAGAVLFLFNGMMVVWLEWQVVHAAVIWLPLQLYFVEKVRLEIGDWRLEIQPISNLQSPILGGLAFALPWLGGHWNWALYGSMTTAVYWLWRLGPLLVQSYRQRDKQGVKAVLGTAVLFFGIGIGISLVQVLPAFNYLRQGHRQAFSFSQSLSLGLKEWAVVALVPDFFGNPIHKNWWGRTNYNEIAFYLGILPLFLLVLATALRRTAVTWFYLVWGGLGLLLALGTPVYGLLYMLPVFNGLWPSRAVTVVVFAAAVLAAMGLEALLDETTVDDRNRSTALGAIVVTALFLLALLAGFLWFYRPELPRLPGDLLWFGVSLTAALALLLGRLAGWLGARPFALLVVLWLAIDLFWTGYDYNTVGDTVDLYPETETAVFLRSDAEPFRITTLPQGVAYPPNSFLQDRLEAVSGYEPAILQRWVDYISAAEGEEAIYFERELMPLRGLDSPLLDAVNLKYVVTIADWYAAEAAAGPAQELVEDWLPLGNTAVSQPITMTEAGLHRIDLPLRLSDGAAGQVMARLFTPDGGQELAHADWDASQPLADGWASFFFDPFPSDWGRDFLLTVEFSGVGAVEAGASGAGLAFRTFYLPRPRLAHEAGKTKVYLNEGYFPRAYVVPQAVTAVDGAAALALVRQNADRLDELVILEADPAVLPPADGGQGTAEIVAYDLNRVVIETNLTAPGWLVLADTYYPGWRAQVDGVATAVYRANSVVRATAVPAGTRTIVFSFLPLDFVAGAIISGLTLLLAGSLLFYGWRKHG
ncbi:MAG: YfhO family protein [Chloroflexi bacterium]|nr:YfhO family protein [Chloroflexota bacterium]